MAFPPGTLRLDGLDLAPEAPVLPGGLQPMRPLQVSGCVSAEVSEPLKW